MKPAVEPDAFGLKKAIFKIGRGFPVDHDFTARRKIAILKAGTLIAPRLPDLNSPLIAFGIDAQDAMWIAQPGRCDQSRQSQVPARRPSPTVMRHCRSCHRQDS